MNCENFELKILEYIEGELPENEAAQVLEHASICKDCAKLLVEYKDQENLLKRYYKAAAEPAILPEKPDLDKLYQTKAPNRKLSYFYAVAASFTVIMLISFSIMIYDKVTPKSKGELIGTAISVMGSVQYINGNTLYPMEEGMEVRSGVRLKTTKDSYLAVKLENPTDEKKNNFIEFKDNTVGSFLAYNNQTVFSLERGEIWVHLNRKEEKPFAVKTSQFLINDIGTIFNVAQGLSAVSVGVVTGAVEFEYSGNDKRIDSGNIFTTIGGENDETLRQHAEWSHYREDLLAMLPEEKKEVVRTPRQLQVPQSSQTPVAMVHYGERLSTLEAVEFLPVDTRFFLRMENPEEIISDWLSSDYGQLFKDPAITQWWESDKTKEFRDKFITEFGANEWLELAKAIDGPITLGVSSKYKPIFIADCRNSQPEVKNIVEKYIQPIIRNWQAQSHGKDVPLPSISQKRGYLVLTFERSLMQEIVSAIENDRPTGFTSTSIYQNFRDNVPKNRIAFAYDFASNTEHIKAKGNQKLNRFLEQTGFDGLDYIVGSPDFSGRGINHAIRVAFKGPRRGIMKWIDEPQSMGSLRFFAPDVHILAAARIKRPQEMFADLLKWTWEAESREPSAEEKEEMDMLMNMASCFGNEVAIGLQNPVLPIPNIQAAIEIIDIAKFDQIIWSIVEEANKHMKNQIIIEVKEYRDYPIVTLTGQGWKSDFSYVVLEDFLIIGPGEPFLRHTIDIFEEKHSLNNEYAFQSFLPDTNQMNYSLIFYQDLSRSLSQIGSKFFSAKLSEREKAFLPNFDSLKKYSAPGIGYLISNDQYMDFYINGSQGVDFNMGGAMPFVASLLMPKLFNQNLESKMEIANDRLKTTATVLEAYKLEYTQYPGELKLLLEPLNYLSEIPTDPFSENGSEPLWYVPTDSRDSYMIYSVGPDGVDDMGSVVYDPTNGLRSNGDIVYGN